jgi:DNA modification methylase
MELKIKEEFKKLIPPLTAEEFKQLETNCIDEGIRDAIVTWQGFIIDGHNRYKIATDWQLSFKTIEKAFDSEYHVRKWMAQNQIGRRNLTDFVKGELFQIIEDCEKEIGKQKLKEIGKLYGEGHAKDKEEPLSIIDKPSHDTRKIVAKKLGWSTGKKAQFDVVKKVAPEEIKEKLRTGEISINQAYQDIKKEEKKVELEQKKEQYIESFKSEIKNTPEIFNIDAVSFLNTFDDNSIDLLVTDPPYATDIDNIEEFTKEWLSIALNKVKKSGRIFICAGAYPNEIKAFLDVLLNQNKFIVDNPLIWTYRNTLGITPKMKYNLNYQMIWHLYSNDSKELDTSITNEMFSVQDINAPDGRIGNRLHTWQKPDELAHRLIRHSSKENDLVVDCFCCTGTFLIAASKLNRIAKGCDINIDNLQIAKNRGCTIIGQQI